MKTTSYSAGQAGDFAFTAENLERAKRFVARYPDAPETEELRPRIEKADVALNETRYEQMLEAALAAPTK